MGWPRTDLMDLLGVRHPIIQAPMAGASTPAMAAAAAKAGGLGSLGLALKSPEDAAADMAAARGLTNRALNVNFFCHQPSADDPDRFTAIRDRLTPYYAEFDLGEPAAEPKTTAPFNADMLEVVLAAAPSVASFHFGLPPSDLLAPLKDAGVIILSSATSPAEARELEVLGTDAIIVQGWEAGGHRGVFDPSTGPGDIGTFALVPQIVDAVSVPVIAAGGIADACGTAAAFMLGASGVQIGTAFLNTPESMVADPHKKALLAERPTGITSAFSGRPARGVVNRYMVEMEDATLPDFPLMNAMTGPLRAASAKEGAGEFMSLWAGQAHAMNRETGTTDSIETLAEETLKLLNG